MGKNSLIKSTSKKTAEKDTEAKKKKAAAKSKKSKKSAPAKTKKAAAQTTPKSKAAAKPKKETKPKAAAKTAPKAKTAAKAKKAAPKKKSAKAPAAKKPVSVKDLLFQKFESWAPKSVFSPPKDESAGRDFTAPPLISADSPEEEKRLRATLFRKFDEASLKSAAEQAAAQKADDEKATEQTAAQKAAADKAFVQKAAAEKAATEKAKAEQPAAPKPSTDKAFIQKAAAEKAAAKKAEPEPEVSVSYPPPPEEAEPADPMEKAFKYGIAGFVALVIVLIGVSFSNTGNYYLQSANGGLKIYQGRFAPMGKELMITLPGIAVQEPVQEVYSRGQVYPLIYNYYVDKADALLEAQGLPDYQGIRRYLNEALAYAPTDEARRAVYERLDGIELMALLYRADVAARRGSIESLEESLDYLNQAAGLEIDESQAELIDQKREAVRAAIEEKKAQAAAAEAGKAATE